MLSKVVFVFIALLFLAGISAQNSTNATSSATNATSTAVNATSTAGATSTAVGATSTAVNATSTAGATSTAVNATSTASNATSTASNATSTVDSIVDCTFISTICPEKIIFICVVFTCPSNADTITLQYKEVGATTYTDIVLNGTEVGYTIGSDGEAVSGATSYNIQVYATTALGTSNNPLALSTVYTTAAESTNPSTGQNGCTSLKVTEDTTAEKTTATWKYTTTELPAFVKCQINCNCGQGADCRQAGTKNPSNPKKRTQIFKKTADIKAKTCSWRVHRLGATCTVTINVRYQRTNKQAKGKPCEVTFTSTYA